MMAFWTALFVFLTLVFQPICAQNEGRSIATDATQEGELGLVSFMESPRSWAYAYEAVTLKLGVMGSSEPDDFEMEIRAIEGSIHNRQSYFHQFSRYNMINDKLEEGLYREFTLVPLFDVHEPEPKHLLLQGDILDSYGNSIEVLSRELELEILAQPTEEHGRYFIEPLSFAQQTYAGGEIPVLVQVFGDYDVQNAEALHFELKGPSDGANAELTVLDPLEPRIVYLMGNYSAVTSIPVLITSQHPGSVQLTAPNVELIFEDAESNGPVIRNLALPQQEYQFIPQPEDTPTQAHGSYARISESQLPGALRPGQQIDASFVITGDISLETIRDLNDFISTPKNLDVTISQPKLFWSDRTVLRQLEIRFSGEVHSFLGQELGRLELPYMDSASGEVRQLTVDFGRIEGLVQPVQLWGFIAFMLVAGMIALFGVRRWIAVLRKPKVRVDPPSEAELALSMHKFVDDFGLTQREREILTILIQGKSAKDIADQLYIAPETARKHIKNIFRKTDTHNRFEVYVKFNEYQKEPGD